MNKLVTITVDSHRYPFGTILAVVKEHKNKLGWVARVAEHGNIVYIAKDNCVEI